MDLSVFFDPISTLTQSLQLGMDEGSMGRHLHSFEEQFPDWREADIILLGSRYQEEDEPYSAEKIRQAFHQYSYQDSKLVIADLGNLKAKAAYGDYLDTLSYVLKTLIAEDKLVLIMGGGQRQSLGQFQAYEEAPSPIAYVHIDRKFDIDAGLDIPHATSYNRLIIEEEGHHLASFTNLAYQRFAVTDPQKEFLQDRYYHSTRLGMLNQSIREAEPELRLAHMVSLDMSAIRFADSPGSTAPSPAGLTAIQACTLARYAGMGYRLSTFSINEFRPDKDIHGQSAQMAAMLMWYVLDGYQNKWEDHPLEDRSNMRKYAVQLHASVQEIPFYKHPLSSRWWMEVPYPDSLGKEFPRSRLVPCSEADYDFARTDNIPERWWLAYNRLMT
ncbi:MAG: arginase family protein [Bacteroidota bacterium]